MNLTYQVPRDAYVDLLQGMIQKNDRRPLKLLTAFLLTAGQMITVILLCIFKLTGSQRTFCLVWSFLVAGITILRRCTARQRAKGTLTRLEYTGQLPEDYWKKHKLAVTEGELRLSYGKVQLSCPLHAVGPVEKREKALYVYCGGTILDIIPISAFSDSSAMNKFADFLLSQAACSEQRKAEVGTEIGMTGGIAWNMDEKSFEDGQYLAYHTLYYRYRFLRKATFIRLAVSVAAMINLVSNQTPLNIGVSILILLLANLENISMVPFICRLRIKKEVGNWRGSHEFHLAKSDGTLIFQSEHASAAIPTDKVILCEELGPYSVIAWNQFPAVVIPRTVVGESTETAELLSELRTKLKEKEALSGRKR